MSSPSEIGSKARTMKKLILTMTGVLVLLATASAQSRLYLSLGANLIRPTDAEYRSIYGNQAIYPELAIAVRVAGGLCLTTHFGQFTRKGTTPELGLETQARQGYITAGLGYLQRISGTFCVEGGAGAAVLRFTEDALDQRVQGNKWGLMAEGGIYYMPEEGSGFFLGLKVGYLAAKVNDIATGVAGAQSVRLGGLKIAVSIGIKLLDTD
jgi:hypothetical protein